MNTNVRKCADLFASSFRLIPSLRLIPILIASVFVVGVAPSLYAQTQVLVETPFQQTSNGFYENFGIGWNYSNDNFFINVPNGVRPPFGMGDPNADARLGFTGRGPGGGRFGVNFTLGQGSTRTNSMTSPMIMLPSGGTGAIFDGSVRPFVTGLIPVVGEGGGQQAISPVQQKLQRMAEEGTLETLGAAVESERMPTQQVASPSVKRQASSAARGDLSVAEIRQRQARTDAPHKVAADKAVALEAEGKLVSAKLQYKRAAEQAPDEERSHWVENFNRISRIIADSKKK